MKKRDDIIFTKEFHKIVQELIPEEVRELLYPSGWNELGIYESVKEAAKIAKKRGINIYL